MEIWLLFLLLIISMTTAVGIVLFARWRKTKGRPAAARVEKAARISNSKYPVLSAVGRTSTLRTWSLVIFVFGLGIIVIGLYGQLAEIRKTELLQNEGVFTGAIVTAKEIETDSEGSDTYYITYSFKPGTETSPQPRIQVRKDVSFTRYVSIDQNSKIDIIYLPSDPQISLIKADYIPGSINFWPMIVAGMIAILALLLSYLLFRQSLKGEQLDREGTSVQVALLEKWIESDSESTTYYIAYQLPGGMPFKYSVSKKVFESLQEDSRIKVRYLPSEPKIFRFEMPV